MSNKKEVKLPEGEQCKFCEHTYIFPCHGKRYDCANAVYIRSKKKINPYGLTVDQLKDIKKTKELPATKEVATKENTTPAAKPKKRKRVRL